MLEASLKNLGFQSIWNLVYRLYDNPHVFSLRLFAWIIL